MVEKGGAVKACALIPAYNEEAHIADVVAGAKAHVTEVFVVDDGSADGTGAQASAAGAIVIRHDRNLGKGRAMRSGLARILAGPYTHVVLIDADLQHDPTEIPRLLAAAERGATLVIGERELVRDAMPAMRFHANVIGSRVLSWFIGSDVADSQSGFRVIACDLLRRVTLTGGGYEIETEMLIKLARAGARIERVTVSRLHYDGARSHIRPFRDTFRTCMLAVRYRFFPGRSWMRADVAAAPVRWHARGLNNRLIFGATCYGVTHLPARVSYALGHVGTWLACRLMRDGTQGLVENVRVVRPHASDRDLHRLALETYRSYGRDVIDFIRGLDMDRETLARRVHEFDDTRFAAVLAEGRGVIVAGGHFGNWELGGVALRRLRDVPLTVVGRPEASPFVGQLRQRMRESLGIETIEIGQALDTALRIRRILESNGAVALLLDRHLGRDRVNVEFFGRTAGFLRSPAMIASLAGSPILPSFMIRRPDGRFSALCGETIRVDSSLPVEDGVRQATQAFASQLESRIRENPHLWYQFYSYFD